MATPKWVGFSATDKTRQALLEEGESVLDERDFTLYRVSELVRTPASGIEIGNQERPCASIEEALAIALPWQGFSLAYQVPELPGRFYFYCWNIPGATGAGLELDPQAIYYSRPGYPEGLWLQNFLLDFTTACELDCCVYGPDVPILEPAELSAVLAGIRDGESVRFLMFRRNKVDNEELRETFPKERLERYHAFPIGKNYYALSRLVHLDLP
ncbi:MAG: hypothetical protein R3F37_18535 [Candidatus Competibacteraceae bacterium]